MKLWGAATAALPLVCVLPALVAGGALSADVDDVRVELTREPEKPRTARATIYRLRLSNPNGGAVTGAKVTLKERMADGMTVAPLRAEPERGVYRGHGAAAAARAGRAPRPDRP